MSSAGLQLGATPYKLTLKRTSLRVGARVVRCHGQPMETPAA